MLVHLSTYTRASSSENRLMTFYAGTEDSDQAARRLCGCLGPIDPSFSGLGWSDGVMGLGKLLVLQFG